MIRAGCDRAFGSQSQQFEECRGGIADHEDAVVKVACRLAHGDNRAGNAFTLGDRSHIRIRHMAGDRAGKGGQAGLADAGQGHVGVGDDTGTASQGLYRFFNGTVGKNHRIGVLKIGAGVDGTPYDLPFGDHPSHGHPLLHR